MYSQLWAMWLLPLAWGLTWRAVSRGKYYAAAAAGARADDRVPLHHGIPGAPDGRGLGARARRARLPAARRPRGDRRSSVVARGRRGCSCRCRRHEMVDAERVLQGTIFNDSYGARKVLGWLFSGELFDQRALPDRLRCSFFVGRRRLRRARRGATCARGRCSARSRSACCSSSAGRRWGRCWISCPGFSDIQIHRFVMGVHLAGILLAGRRARLAAPNGVRARRSRVRAGDTRAARRRGARGGRVVVLVPAWIERSHYDGTGRC